MKKLTLLGFLLVAIGIIGGGYYFTLSQVKINPEKQVKVGLLAPLSGEAGSYGTNIQRGVELAKQEYRASNVELVSIDSQCEAEAAKEAMRSLIDQGVEAVVGEACSGATLAVIPMLEEGGVVLVSPASTSPELSGISDYFFRTIPSDELQGEFAAKYISQQGGSKLAVLYTNEAYGQGYYEVVKKAFVNLGGSITAALPFAREQVGFYDEALRIAKLEPDSVLVISNSPAAAVAILVELSKTNLDVPLYGSEGLKGDVVAKDAGAEADGLIVFSVKSGSETYRSSYMAEYGTEPGTYSAQAYDAFGAIMEAINTEDGATLAQRLAKVDFNGASGRINFDENGNIGGSYDLFKLVEGEFVQIQE